jgi:hypothetical protein
MLKFKFLLFLILLVYQEVAATGTDDDEELPTIQKIGASTDGAFGDILDHKS